MLKTAIISRNKNSLKRPLLWSAFIIYVVLLGITMAHHEMWGDEIHSWNIAKGSSSFGDLISNTRFEGHPPVWYIMLWIISKFTHNLSYVQLVHVVIASSAVFILLFFSPLPEKIKLLIPFGYFFVFEYSVLSRNYAIAILFAFLICTILQKRKGQNLFVYYLLIFLLSNTHLLGLVLAISFHVVFLFSLWEENKKLKRLIPHIAAGVLFVISLYFISPPANGTLNLGFWLSNWSRSHVAIVAQSPLRAFLPMPAWWEFGFWNDQFLIALHRNVAMLKFLSPLVSLCMILLAWYVLRSSRKALVFFFVNLLLTFLVGLLFPLTTERYAGFIFIAFIIALWLKSANGELGRRSYLLICGLLVVHLIAGVFCVIRDIKFPFSNANKVQQLLGVVPSSEKIVTDYWAMNTISAFVDRPFYCIDFQGEKSFVLWGPDMARLLKKPNRYSDGIRMYLAKEKIDQLYMISTGSLQQLAETDPTILQFHVSLIDKREGAIEKGGNLYLYRIKSLP